MLPLRFVGLLVILLAVQAWCKPPNSSESTNYNDDDPSSDYNDDEDVFDEDDDPGAFEEPPTILSKPESIHVRSGSTIRLPCLLRNADGFSVTWKKDDTWLYPINEHNRTVRLENNTLVIYNAIPNDTSNNYECSILAQPPVTIKHKVLVSPEGSSVPSSSMPPHRQQHPYHTKRIEVNAGQNVTIPCASMPQQGAEVKWYHENERVHSNVIASGRYVTIMNITRRDAGRYQCLIEDGSNNPPLNAINVVVNYVPEIETKGKWVHTGLGVESRLTCIVHAHPHAEVTWYKDQRQVSPKKGSIETRGNKTRHVLEILHTEKEHLGNYTCMAENTMGRAERTISLTGLPSQAIISGGEMTKTASGLILKWQLESYSPITEYRLEYRRKGDETWTTLKPTVTNGKGNQFTVEHTIEGLEPGSYEAILRARNDFGWSPPSQPHTFEGDYKDEQDESVKESTSSGVSQTALAIATLFLVVSSCAFTSL